MYKELPFIKSPNNESIKIWKYMNFVKFVSLLDGVLLRKLSPGAMFFDS